MRFLWAGSVAVLFSMSPALSDAVSADRWKTHLTEDLLPFWSDPYAAGTPIGSFAGNLCNDGSAPVSGAACDGVTKSRATNPQQTLVGQARQVFSYAVAFHMTGDKTYLDLARAGVDYQFDTFLDPDTGLFFETHNINTGGKNGRYDGQKQAYGLLGAGFLYYLTGDEDLYARIKPVEAAITDTYRISADGSYKGLPTSSGPANAIAKHLDHLNAYKTLLAAQVPLADRDALLSEALESAYELKDNFYDPITGFMRPSLSTDTGSVASADFGHSVKSFWFIDQTAKLAGDDALSRFAQDVAKQLFETAYQEDRLAWATNFGPDGLPRDTSHWWGFAELNQFAASLAIEDPALRDMLLHTQSYWLDHYVDADNGGIWLGVNTLTNAALTDLRKHYEWKAGFHSYEHALINYLSDAAMAGEDIDLFFARADASDLSLAYGFDGDLFGDTQIAEDGTPIARMTVANLTYAAAPVPLPAAAGLLLGALVLLGSARLARPSKD